MLKQAGDQSPESPVSAVPVRNTAMKRFVTEDRAMLFSGPERLLRYMNRGLERGGPISPLLNG
jgi:hypothetical protein